MRRAGAALAVFLAGATLRAQDIALVGATIHPVSGPDISGGTVLIHAGKIDFVGPAAHLVAGVERVDVAGKHIYPSLFPPVTVLGLVEIQSVRSTIDTTEIGEINPQARADEAMNFDSELLPVARSAGILVAGVTPIEGIVSGTLSVMKLEGWTREDATVKAPAAMTVFWPDLDIDRSATARFSVRLQEKRRDEAVRKLEVVFADAKAYAKARAAEGQSGVPRHDVDPKLEALVPAVEGKIPVIVVAHSVAQIRAALAWAKKNNIKLVLGGVEDGWRVAGEIAAAQVPVVVETLDLPHRSDAPYDVLYANPGVLAKAGVRVAFNDGADPFAAATVRNLVEQAGVAVAYGMPRDKAVAAMTLEPARILNVADRLGSLENGKDATLIVTDGDILDLRTRVVAAYLDGKLLDLTDKQKRLYERYRNRPKPNPAER
ncbi:MAG TPA: amidohydrolase family protein [Thermoanaerobaculia bacterium]|nr:amidohydrolase family protein [Thermoanaerobaculia bacterium]